MSVRKQSPRLCKLYSFYKQLPEEFLDETDVDRYFYHNIFDISQSQKRLIRVSKISNKNCFAFKWFQFCNLKTQQGYIFQEEVNDSRKGISVLLDSLRDFLNIFEKAGKCLYISLPNPKIEIGSTKSKDNLFAHYYDDIMEHSNIQNCFIFRFGNNNSCVFSIKMFELHGSKTILTEIAKHNIREIQPPCKKRFYVAKKFERIESIYDV